MQKENTMTVGQWCGRWFMTTTGCIRFFAKFVVKSVSMQQKFDVKGVDRLRKFVVFFAIRWYTIFAV